MSDYADIVPLKQGRITDQSTAGIVGYIAMPKGGFIHGITAYVYVAAAEALAGIKVRIENAGADVVSLTIGGNSVDSKLTARTSDANARRDANTGYEVVTVTNDSTVEYEYWVWGSPQI